MTGKPFAFPLSTYPMSSVGVCAVRSIGADPDCARASRTPAATISADERKTRRFIRPPDACSKLRAPPMFCRCSSDRLLLPEVEYVLRRGPAHALLEILLPDMGPRAAEHVGHLELDLGARYERRVVTVDQVDRLDAVAGHERRLALVIEFIDLYQVADDANRLRKRLVVVHHRFVGQADELAVLADRRVHLDRLHLVRELELRVRLPALDVARPGDQHVLVPEPDGLAIPARHRGTEARNTAGGHIGHVELAADVDVLVEVFYALGSHLHEVRRGDAVALAYGRRIPAPHETFRPAECRRPHRVPAHLVIRLLHRALLVLRLQQRHDRGDLRVCAPIPVLLLRHAAPARGLERGLVHAVPLACRKVLEGVYARAAAAFRLLEQRLVVLLRTLEGVRAHDRLAR